MQDFQISFPQHPIQGIKVAVRRSMREFVHDGDVIFMVLNVIDFR